MSPATAVGPGTTRPSRALQTSLDQVTATGRRDDDTKGWT